MSRSKPDPEARAQLLDAELTRLRKELGVLDRQWNQRFRLSAFALLALPAAYFDVVYAIIMLMCTPALILTQSYLIGVRRNECRELIAESRRELAQLRPVPKAEPSAAPSPTTPPPSSTAPTA